MAISLYADQECTIPLENYGNLFSNLNISVLNPTSINDSATIWAKKDGSEKKIHCAIKPYYIDNSYKLDGFSFISAQIGEKEAFCCKLSQTTGGYAGTGGEKFSVDEMVMVDGTTYGIATITEVNGNKISFTGSSVSALETNFSNLVPLGDMSSPVEITINRVIPAAKTKEITSYNIQLFLFWE